MKTFEEIIDINLEQQFEVEPPPIAPMEIETEPTELEKTMANIDAIQESWNKLQEEVLIEPYVPTQEDINNQKISELKANLAATDYQAIKYAEGQLTAEEYEPMKVQRQAWRNEINKLEGGI